MYTIIIINGPHDSHRLLLGLNSSNTFSQLVYTHFSNVRTIKFHCRNQRLCLEEENITQNTRTLLYGSIYFFDIVATCFHIYFPCFQIKRLPRRKDFRKCSRNVIDNSFFVISIYLYRTLCRVIFSPIKRTK